MDEQENLNDITGIFSQSSHPHMTQSAGAYTIAVTVGATGPTYAVVNYPPPDAAAAAAAGGRSSVAQSRIVARVKCSSPTEPNYMHSFSITENYYVIIEQPLVIPLNKTVACIIRGKPLGPALKWRQTEVLSTFIHLTSFI